MADHLGGIVKAATAAESGEAWVSALPCRRRRNRNACTGTISLIRTDVPPSIEWRCTGCDDMGEIGGWEGFKFDLRERTPPGASTPRGKQMRLEATSDVVSVLREIEILDLACERAVFAARVESGRIFLKLNDEELEELAELLAAEANHEPNRRREKRLDAAFMLLTAAQEDGRASSGRKLGDGCFRDGVRRVPTTAPTGRWRIDDSDLWDRDALDLVGAAYVEFARVRLAPSALSRSRVGSTIGPPRSTTGPASSSLSRARTKVIRSAAAVGPPRSRATSSSCTSSSTWATTRRFERVHLPRLLRNSWDEEVHVATPAGPAEYAVTMYRPGRRRTTGVSYYDILVVEIYDSARRHGVSDSDIEHCIDHAMVVAEDDEDKVLYLGPDRAGNLLEIVTVQRDDDTEVVIHAMPIRRIYEDLLPEAGDDEV
jgi:hypothetical protein